MTIQNAIIIGSGPAGVATALALIERGVRPMLLDLGITLEHEKRTVVSRLAAQDKRRWHPDDVKAVKGSTQAHCGGVDCKYVFGSAYPYGPDPFHPLESDNARMFASMAKGGLSNAWGGAMLPFAAEDIRDWPFDLTALEPHYKAMARVLRPTGKDDGLARPFPPYCPYSSPGSLSRQATGLLASMQEHRDRLEREGIIFGLARLAVDFGPIGESGECARCGLCLYGCPWDRIFNSANVLDGLVANDLVDYRPGVHVEAISTSQGTVHVSARSYPDGAPLSFESATCFLGAGILSTTRILLRSLEIYSRPHPIAHSDYFTIPLLRFAGVPDVSREEVHTLAQIFMELRDPDICPHTVHMQVYGYNDLMEQAASSALGPLAGMASPFLPMLLGRMLVIQGYLHSSHSSRIFATLEPGERGRLRIEGRNNPEAREILGKVIRKFARTFRFLKAFPLSPLASFGLPGAGNHSGGSFPMRQAPGEHETDMFGALPSLPGVFAVDSSVFPSVPATTLTLTIMANAHRIASQASVPGAARSELRPESPLE